MLSRVANSIYWMNRYLERAENYARFLNVNFNLCLELPPDYPEQWQPLVETTGDLELYNSLYGKITKDNVLYFMGFDEKNPNSICSSLQNVRENARMVRSDITRELWEQVNYLYYFMNEEKANKFRKKKDDQLFFNDIKKGCQLLYGIFDATISRTEGWHFGKIGQLLERADKISRVLDVKYLMLLPTPQEVGSPLDIVQWAALLKSVSAYDMYRKKYGKLTIIGIAEFLIFNKEFPRSMLYTLTQMENSLYALSGSQAGYVNSVERELGMLKSQLEYGDINEVINSGLHEYLDNFQLKLNQISLALFDSFFKLEH